MAKAKKKTTKKKTSKKAKKVYVAKDPYEEVTNRIIEQLDKGEVPWRKPWIFRALSPQNFTTKKDYRGFNIWFLHALGHSNRYWLSYKQAMDLAKKKKIDIKIEAGTGQPVVYYKKIMMAERDERGNLIKDEKGQIRKKSIPMLKYSIVYNVQDIKGLEIPEGDLMKDQIDFTPIVKAEKIVKDALKRKAVAKVVDEKNSRAAYSPTLDHIIMPPKNSFESEMHYYSTLFHEMAHSTGHHKRLDRKDGMNSSGMSDKKYMFEELVAEFTACFLMAHAGMDCENTFVNSAAYIKGWSSRLKADPKMLIKAASASRKASNLILGIEEEQFKEGE